MIHNLKPIKIERITEKDKIYSCNSIGRYFTHTLEIHMVD